MLKSKLACHIDQTAQKALVAWAHQIQTESKDDFTTAQTLVRRLGAHWISNDKENSRHAQFGFWVPELVERGLTELWLELLRPDTNLDLLSDEQTLIWQRQRLPLTLTGNFAWATVIGTIPGSRHQIGDFYRLTYQENGRFHTLLDPLAHSVPFGGKAPAELYDMPRLNANRADRAHFQQLDTQPDPDGVPRVQAPINILQIHTNTASAPRTLAGLTAVYQTIAAKIKAGTPLTPAEQNYIGYDSVQLMPVEPIIEYEAGPLFWREDPNAETADSITTYLKQPDMTNWGYDVLTVASPAVNPCLLSSKRPDELVDFIATLHNFPGQPIKVLFDIVYGHTDNQTLPYLNEYYFAGANMYGQNLRYKHPVIRAILLEMQKRKNDFGIDGVRVDGAQDFKWWEAETDLLHHDDDYLALMNNITQEVAGVQYRPWMIFEDGRPWPREDWELASTYREVTRLYANVVQWGPLTFAHNTPFLFTFWANKWWRIREIMEVGSHWITGCANHDTLRRGTQVNPEARVNTYLGDTLLDIYQNGYDNPAAKLFDYVLCPGIPMDFINAAMRAPWSFMRNTDDKWGVKVVSEEAFFLDWAVNATRFAQDFAFVRIKQKWAFTELAELSRFLRALDGAVKMTAYDLNTMAHLLSSMNFPTADFTPQSLKQFARDWMDDVHDYCNVSHWRNDVSPERAAYNLALRQFRRQRPYLQNNLKASETFGYLHPTVGTILFYGLRASPDNREQLLFAANMEGAPRTLVPAQLPIPNLPQDGWQVALTTPGLKRETAVNNPLTLADSQGIIFKRNLSIEAIGN